MMTVITLSLPLANRGQLPFAFKISALIISGINHGGGDFLARSGKLWHSSGHGKQGRTKTRSEETEKEEASGGGPKRLPAGEGTAEAVAVTIAPARFIV
jgi:hypothetical protein